MASIDFCGVTGVLDAYEARNLDTWAIFNKKNFMQSGAGADCLRDYLQLMEVQGSSTVYTCKVYRNEAPEDITDKTECNGSFSFRLQDTHNYAMGRVGGYGVGSNLDARLAAIEKKLNVEGKEEKEPTIMGTVMGWLQDPKDVVTIVGAVKMLLGKSSTADVMSTVQALAGVEPQRAGMLVPTSEGYELTAAQEQTIQRFAVVIDRLEKCDPDILVHLEQLALLAETNQAMYKMALQFLSK